MFMQRIDTPARIAAKKRPLALKLAAGLLLIAAAIIVMPIWLAACAFWFAGTFLAKAPRLGWRTTIWAGELVVGR
jgi:hypothetical protein